MTLPPELKYTATHEWIRPEPDGLISIGITEHAQELLGDMVFIEIPEVGRKLVRNKECGVVESVKAASDIYAPVSGEVVAVNGALETAPEKINEDAFEAWIFKLKPDDGAELEGLLDASAYQELIDSQEHG
ncbi:MAG: glycine cleavage system protein GcvH [Burkholderiales bacterium]|nr:glycine cleavage system protein GcvH [Pseudomonadota bacterium]